MTFINQAFAAEAPSAETTTTTGTTATTETSGAAAPSAMGTADPLIMNIGMVLVMGVLFYLLLIRPQQKRYKEHNEMLGKLDKGAKVVTQGGLVGVIEKTTSEHEVLVDFGNGVKMNVMRSYILGRYEDSVSTNAANDTTKAKDKSSK